MTRKNIFLIAGVALLVGCNQEQPKEINISPTPHEQNKESNFNEEVKKIEDEGTNQEQTYQEELGQLEQIASYNVDGVNYTITYNEDMGVENFLQLWKMEVDHSRILVDEGTFINFVPRKDGFCTYVFKYKEDGEYEGAIKRYKGKDDIKGEYILTDIVDYKDSSNGLMISGNTRGEGPWCVIEGQANDILLIDDNDKVIKELDVKSDSDQGWRLEPYAWSEKGDKLWCLSLGTYDVHKYTIINIQSLEAQTIMKEEEFDDEYVLNPDTGWIAYSDMPVIFDTEGHNEFMAGQNEVNFRIKNLLTGEKIELATSINKEFAPKWIDQNIIEYNDPNGEGRLTYKLSDRVDID